MKIFSFLHYLDIIHRVMLSRALYLPREVRNFSSDTCQLSEKSIMRLSHSQRHLFLSVHDSYVNYFDPVRMNLVDDLTKKRFKLISERKKVRSLFFEIKKYKGNIINQCALDNSSYENSPHKLYLEGRIIETASSLQKIQRKILQNSCQLLTVLYYPLLYAAGDFIYHANQNISLDEALIFLYSFSSFWRHFPSHYNYFEGDKGKWSLAELQANIYLHPLFLTFEILHLGVYGNQITALTCIYHNIDKYREEQQLYYYLYAYVRWILIGDNQLGDNHIKFLHCKDLLIHAMSFLKPCFDRGELYSFFLGRGVLLN